MIGAAALLIRLAPLLHHGVATDNDSARYIEIAHGIRAGCGFARFVNGRCGAPDLFRTPGYPLLLAAVPSLRAAVAMQALIGAALCFGIALFTLSFWGAGSAIIAELLLALDIPSIQFGAEIMSDIPFQALVTAAVLIAVLVMVRRWSGRRAVAAICSSALLIGLAILVRPAGILLIPLAAIAFIIAQHYDWRGRLAVAALALAIPALISLGWMARNAVRSGVWTLSTDGVIVAYYFDAAAVLHASGAGGFGELQARLARSIDWNIQGYEDTPVSRLDEMRRRALAIFVAHPQAFAEVAAGGLLWLAIVPDRGNLNDWLGTAAGSPALIAAGTATGKRIREMLRSPLLTVLVVFQFAAIIFAWSGVVILLKRVGRMSATELTLILVLLGAIAAVLLPAAGGAAVARYRVPAMPLIAILSAAGWRGRFRPARREADQVNVPPVFGELRQVGG